MNKFKVGDRVKMSVDDGQYFPKGCVVTVIQMDGTDIPYRVKDSAGNMHWLRESDVAPVEEHTKEKFYVGQRVRIRKWDDMVEEFGVNEDGNINIEPIFNHIGMKLLCGKIATISSINGKYVGLDDFQNCDYLDRCWTYTTDMIEPADNQTIVIRSDGKVTTAYLKDGHKTVKSAKATCSPADAFDFYAGADIALKRLFDKPMEEEKAAIEPKFKFNIDEKVKVVNGMKAYSNYKEFVGKYAPQLYTNFHAGDYLNTGTICRVIKHAEHLEFKGRLLYIIMDMESLQVYVIGEDGLESAE